MYLVYNSIIVLMTLTLVPVLNTGHVKKENTFSFAKGAQKPVRSNVTRTKIFPAKGQDLITNVDVKVLQSFVKRLKNTLTNHIHEKHVKNITNVVTDVDLLEIPKKIGRGRGESQVKQVSPNISQWRTKDAIKPQILQTTQRLNNFRNMSNSQKQPKFSKLLEEPEKTDRKYQSNFSDNNHTRVGTFSPSFYQPTSIQFSEVAARKTVEKKKGRNIMMPENKRRIAKISLDEFKKVVDMAIANTTLQLMNFIKLKKRLNKTINEDAENDVPGNKFVEEHNNWKTTSRVSPVKEGSFGMLDGKSRRKVDIQINGQYNQSQNSNATKQASESRSYKARINRTKKMFKEENGRIANENSQFDRNQERGNYQKNNSQQPEEQNKTDQYLTSQSQQQSKKIKHSPGIIYTSVNQQSVSQVTHSYVTKKLQEKIISRKNHSTLNYDNNNEHHQYYIPEREENDSPSSVKNHTEIINKTSPDFASHPPARNTIRNNDTIDQLERIQHLIASVTRNPFDNWIYHQRTFDELGITPSLMKSGIVNLGSSKAMKRVVRKAIKGDRINVMVVGGSISAGGGLWKDRGNIDGVYHKAVKRWWQKTITPITHSQIEVNNVAIGGTDSEYFSYCISNFLKDLPDLVFWELSANDYNKYNNRDFDPSKPLEQLTRLLLQLPSHPALIYVNFFRGDRQNFEFSEKCPNSEETEVDILSKYYEIPSLSWRKMVCNLITLKRSFVSEDLFGDDGYHPSLLGHAQVAMLLITYIKGIFESVLAEELQKYKMFDDEENSLDDVDLSEFQLKIPAFRDPLYPKPSCWTLLTPDDSVVFNNTLTDVNVLKGDGFELIDVTSWQVRTDRIQCLVSKKPGAILNLNLNVPVLDEDKDLPLLDAQTRTLAFATHNKYGGAADIQLDELPSKTSITTKSERLKRSQIHIVSENVRPGLHYLQFKSLSKGFCLTSIMVL